MLVTNTSENYTHYNCKYSPMYEAICNNICDWICKKGFIHAIINIYKYNSEILNSIYLKND